MADREPTTAATSTRCPESSQEGARCIHEAGHDGKHFAKDGFSYYSWETRSDAAAIRESRAEELLRLIRWAENASHFGPEDFTKLSRLACLAKELAHV